MPTETRKTGTPVSVRLTPEDRAAIECLAEDAGLSLSSFMREAAMRRKITSAIDRETLLALGRLKAESGRVGGLLRWWLTDAPDERTGRSHSRGAAPPERVPEINGILGEVRQTQSAIREAAIALRDLHIGDIADDR